MANQIFQFHALAGTKRTKVFHKRHGGKQTPNELTKGGNINISRFGRLIFLMNIKVVPQNLYINTQLDKSQFQLRIRDSTAREQNLVSFGHDGRVTNTLTVQRRNIATLGALYN